MKEGAYASGILYSRRPFTVRLCVIVAMVAPQLQEICDVHTDAKAPATTADATYLSAFERTVRVHIAANISP